MKRFVRMSVLAIVCAAAGILSSQAAHTQGISCLVTTGNGDVQGVDRGASCAFLAVPYARPPLGNLRWKPPQPADPWTPAVLNATSSPPPCAQVLPTGPPSPTSSEDCLKLNIWIRDPKPISAAPVIVWFHPGNFVAASVNNGNANGQNLAEQTGAIIVAANYRLGPFGFLAHSALTKENLAYPSSGNYGLLDQRAALAWVRDNIAAFGGDPFNVTIAGASAGGHSVGAHLLSPGSAGLFHRAIMQSGYSSFKLQTLEESEIQGSAFATAIGCTDSAMVLTCMRAATRDQVLLALSQGTFEFNDRPTHWTPNVDAVEIPDQPRALFEAGAFARVPVMLGMTRDEGWTWVNRSFPAALSVEQLDTALETEFGQDAPAIGARYPLGNFASAKDALAQLTGDVEYTCEAKRLARLIERTGTSVYLYSFEYEVDPVALDRVIHGLETNFVFGNNFSPPFITHTMSDADRDLSRKMGGYWARFAATGNPNIDDFTVVHWPAFKHPTGGGRGPDKYLILDTTIREGHRLREAQCDFWEPYFFRSITGPVPAGAS